jgi:hypothetical protein
VRSSAPLLRRVFSKAIGARDQPVEIDFAELNSGFPPAAGGGGTQNPQNNYVAEPAPAPAAAGKRRGFGSICLFFDDPIEWLSRGSYVSSGEVLQRTSTASARDDRSELFSIS